MRVFPVDERDSGWEKSGPRFRVYLQTRPEPGYGSATSTHDIEGADVTEAIAWAEAQVAQSEDDLVYSVALVYDDRAMEQLSPGRGRGLVWLLGGDVNDIGAPSATISTTTVHIEEDDLSRPEVQRLLTDHLADMHATSPAESVHALDLDGLRAPDIALYSAWLGDAVAGCGALKDLGDRDVELKSMRTSASFRGRGVGTVMLRFLLAEAGRRGARRVLLETGTQPFFEPAHRLYERHGFTSRGPFGAYADDPHSRFYELVL